MMRVMLQPEPSTFPAKVRRPGTAFLSQTPHPTAAQWRTRNYWVRVLPEMHEAYGGICSYSCHWIPLDTGARTIEHFVAKTTAPRLAYEWSNYRLVCSTLNGRKGIHEDVLDPFELSEHAFVLDFPSLLIKPNTTLSSELTAQVNASIVRLGLNDEGTCLKSRVKWLSDYCTVPFSLAYLHDHAPFIASELQRQQLVERIRDIFRA